MGKSETAPAEYVKWAQSETKRLGLTFTGTPDQINEMIARKLSCCGDIYLDYGVRGHKLDRPGLNGLLREMEQEANISHVLIPRRDRLARPKFPEDAIQIENRIQAMGITIVFMDKQLEPIRLGQQPRLEDAIIRTVEYHQASKTSRDLSNKLILAKRYLAEHGLAAGGAAAYGFERWLVGPNNKPVRPLANGECTKIAGHHVRHLPTNLGELDTVIRIKDYYKVKSLTKIAELLTAEGIPPPCKSRRITSGVWNAKTIRNIIANPIYIGVLEYGKICSGEYFRFTKNGPRELTASDLNTIGKPKIVQNDPGNLIRTQLDITPVYPSSDYERNLLTMQQRNESRKAIPRSRGENPLGARLYDWSCGWQMYRQPAGMDYQYVCGLYKQTDGKCCAHNTIRGKQMVAFVLKCIRQRILSPTMLTRLRARVQAIIEDTYGMKKENSKKKELERELKNAKSDLIQAGRNLALLRDHNQINAVKGAFDEIQTRVSHLETQLCQPCSKERNTVEHEVAQAMLRLQELDEMAALPQNRDAVDNLFGALNVRLFCRFAEVLKNGRSCNRLIGGMVSFGSNPPPIKTYDGPTGRAIVKSILAKGNRKSLFASGDEFSKRPNGMERSLLRNKNCRTQRAVELFKAFA